MRRHNIVKFRANAGGCSPISRFSRSQATWLGNERPDPVVSLRFSLHIGN